MVPTGNGEDRRHRGLHPEPRSPVHFRAKPIALLGLLRAGAAGFVAFGGELGRVYPGALLGVIDGHVQRTR